MRKRKPYRGILSVPIGSPLPQDAAAFVQDLEAYCDRFSALLAHHGISTNTPGWSRDLALRLAWIHERGLLEAGGGISICRVFEHYGVDPTADESDLLLALELASKHVPAFAVVTPVERKPRIEPCDMAHLAITAATVTAALESTGRSRDTLQRAVARVLRDPKELEKYVDSSWVGRMSRILNEYGNDERTNPKPLSDRALRTYLSDMEKAWSAYQLGKANPFQKQFVEVVLPMLLGPAQNQSPDHAGQN